MKSEEYVCTHCDAEFLIETDVEVEFCPCCGTKLDMMDEPLYDEEEYE